MGNYRGVQGILLLGLGILGMAAAAGPAEYDVEVLVAGHGFHGIHGLTFDSEDRLYVGSVLGQSIYRINTVTAEAETYIGSPKGMADDLEFGPDGTLVWTAFLVGTVYAKSGDGPVRELATGLPGINSIAFKQDGRLFATQVFLGDALYEIDLEGKAPARKIMENMGGLNGFDFGPDGHLYGPLWFKGQVARVNVDTAELTVVAEGFETPAAVNFDSKGDLYVLDTKAGKIYRVDLESGSKKLVCELATAMDNLAFDSRDRMFVTVMANNALYEVNTQTGTSREVIWGALAVPCDIAVYTDGDAETLYVSDLFALRTIDGRTGDVHDIARNYADELETPIGISVNRDHILASSWFTGTVQQFDRRSHESLVIAHNFAAPMDAIELAGGEWIVLEGATGTLTRVASDDRERRTTIATGLEGGVAMTSAGPGTVYISRSQGAIVRVALESGLVTVVASGLQGPEGLDIAPDGRIVVAEVGAKRLVSIDPADGTLEVLAENLPIGLPAPAGALPSYTPTGVAVSDSGTIYLSSDLEDAVYRIRRKR